MTLVAPLTDFPDRLSPMVVKELRQGLRTRLFGGVMLVLHLLLVIVTLLTGAARNSAEVVGVLDGLVWFVLVILMPLSCFSALSGEIKGGTLEMLVLTRLSAGRIVLGKWAATALQSLLVAVSVVPYVVARYVYGGSELFADLSGLGLQWLLSAVLTAAVVALSTQKQFWLRALFVGLPLFMFGLSSFSWLMIRSIGGSSLPGGLVIQNMPWLAHLAWLAAASWLIFALLSFAASRIAPASSQLPLVKRLVHLAVLLVISGLEVIFGSGSGGFLVMTGFVTVVASVDALADDVHGLPSLYVPFYRRSWWGRLVSWFLAPGWMHGFAYSLVLAVAIAGGAFAMGDADSAAKFWLVMCAVWMSAFFGHLLAFRRKGDYFSALVAGGCLMAFFNLMGAILARPLAEKGMDWLLYLLPAYSVGEFNQGAGHQVFGTLLSGGDLAVVASLLWPFLLGLLALRMFGKTSRARVEAWKILRP